jgi:hypothetical protein
MPGGSCAEAPGIELRSGMSDVLSRTVRAYLKGHSQGLEHLAIEMLARRLSMRDIKDESGRLRLPKMFVDGMAERCAQVPSASLSRRPGATRWTAAVCCYSDGGVEGRCRDGDG